MRYAPNRDFCVKMKVVFLPPLLEKRHTWPDVQSIWSERNRTVSRVAESWQGIGVFGSFLLAFSLFSSILIANIWWSLCNLLLGLLLFGFGQFSFMVFFFVYFES